MFTTKRTAKRVIGGLAIALTAAGLGIGAHAATADTQFPTHGRFDYQIGGAYTPATTTKIVTRDSTVASAGSGFFNICYINAFQTQPGEGGSWDQSLLLKDKRTGKNLEDPDWKGEYLFDTSTDAKRQAIFSRLKGLLDTCSSKGYQAIEPDNLDTYSRDYVKSYASVPPTKEANVKLLNMLGYYSHAKGMLIAQKNADADSAYIKANAYTDFAVAEECERYQECGEYTKAYGDKLIEIEYNDYDDVNPTTVFNRACTARGATASVIERDRNVVAKGQSGYFYKLCSNG